MTDKIQDLVEILKLTKDSSNIDYSAPLSESLSNIGISQSQEIDRDTRIEIALLAISKGFEIEEIVQHLTWKDFEGFVARVLQENDYLCTESFRRRGNQHTQGMEIDVIGVKGRTILAIDAKMWGVRSGKSSALRDAVSKQAIRTNRLGSELDRLREKIPSMSPGSYTLIPIMVTWLVEEVEIHEGVPVVPIFKLNGFLLELARFEDFVISFDGELESKLTQSRL